jgi:hypothetical protein
LCVVVVGVLIVFCWSIICLFLFVIDEVLYSFFLLFIVVFVGTIGDNCTGRGEIVVVSHARLFRVVGDLRAGEGRRLIPFLDSSVVEPYRKQSKPSKGSLPPTIFGDPRGIAKLSIPDLLSCENPLDSCCVVYGLHHAG